MERFRILDHGCKVNRYDGEVVRAELRRFGLTESVAADEPADLVVLNACAVTDRAVQKGRQAIRRLRRTNPGARLIVSGCMTATDRQQYRRIDAGIATLPSGERDRLRETLTDLLGDAVAARPEQPRGLDGVSFQDRTRAFLKVEDGCDSKCSFCVIPQIRGGVRSRSRREILEEARDLVTNRGFKELVLCGIHLGHYGRDTGDDVLDLARALTELEGDFRIRLSSLEITEVDDALARTVAEHRPRIAPHLHVPLQSGDDGVLRAMRRPYTVRRFLDRIQRVRDANPDLAVTTDVIVGFPGETEEAFEETLRAVREARFSKVHVFPFSPRAGTDAAALEGRVEAGVQRRRVATLLREERNQRMELDEARIGEPARILVESRSESGCSGLSEHYRRVRLPLAFPPATFVDCQITGRNGDDLLGAPIPT